jgi:hypothetical protein
MSAIETANRSGRKKISKRIQPGTGGRAHLDIVLVISLRWRRGRNASSNFGNIRGWTGRTVVCKPGSANTPSSPGGEDTGEGGRSNKLNGFTLSLTQTLSPRRGLSRFPRLWKYPRLDWPDGRSQTRNREYAILSPGERTQVRAGVKQTEWIYVLPHPNPPQGEGFHVSHVFGNNPRLDWPDSRSQIRKREYAILSWGRGHR